MSEHAIKELELSIEFAQGKVDLAERLERLHSNPDFKALIVEGYFKDEAVRLVGLKAAPSVQDEKNQSQIIKEIDGIGCLRGYFGKIYHEAELAQRAIAESQEEIEAIEAETGVIV